MKDGVCRASLDTLGADINIDRATVMRNIKKLCELGYLSDQTPDRRNAPHTYTLAKTVVLCNTSDDKTVVTRNSSENETVAERNKSVAYNNSFTETVAESKATVAESNLNIVFKETLKETKEKESGKPPANSIPETIPAVKVHVDVTGKWLLNKTQIAEIDKVVGRDPPALEKWRETVKTWVMRGNKPTNLDGQLDWFRDGIPVYQKASPNGHKQPKHPAIPTAPEEQARLARIAATLAANDTG